MAITSYLPKYIDLFVGRNDDYAIQLKSGRYRRAGKPLTTSDVYDHLAGRHTYGTYIGMRRGELLGLKWKDVHLDRASCRSGML